MTFHQIQKLLPIPSSKISALITLITAAVLPKPLNALSSSKSLAHGEVKALGPNLGATKLRPRSHSVLKAMFESDVSITLAPRLALHCTNPGHGKVPRKGFSQPQLAQVTGRTMLVVAAADWYVIRLPA